MPYPARSRTIRRAAGVRRLWLPPRSRVPFAITRAASGVLFERAVLRGYVVANGFPTTYWFEYGETVAYGSQTAKVVGFLGAAEVTAEIEGLRSGVPYHFRLRAESAEGAAVGSDEVLTTAAGILRRVRTPRGRVGGKT